MGNLHSLFFYHDQVRSGWRALIFILLSVVLAIGLAALKQLILQHELRLPLDSGEYGLFTAVIFSSWLVTRYLDRRPFGSLGLKFHSRWFTEGTMGLLLGFSWLLATSIFRLKFDNPSLQLSVSQLAAVPWTLPIITLVGVLFEEYFFRGYLLQSLVVGVGPIPALLLTSILFGLGHSYEGGIMAILNASLLGVALGLTVIQTRSLWLAVGFHYGWDIMASLLPVLVAIPSSGLKLSNPAFTVSLILLFVLLYAIKTGPTPQAKALWDCYIHPAPWPPWKHRVQLETESLPDPPSPEDGERRGEE